MDWNNFEWEVATNKFFFFSFTVYKVFLLSLTMLVMLTCFRLVKMQHKLLLIFKDNRFIPAWLLLITWKRTKTSWISWYPGELFFIDLLFDSVAIFSFAAVPVLTLSVTQVSRWFNSLFYGILICNPCCSLHLTFNNVLILLYFCLFDASFW